MEVVVILPAFQPPSMPMVVPTMDTIATSASVEKTDDLEPMMMRESRSRP